jgi:ATP-dependent DNA helicase RecQ
MNAVAVDVESFNTLRLTEQSRAVLRGEVVVSLREKERTERKERRTREDRSAIIKAPIALDSEGLIRYAALKAWRSQIAKEHNLPAYVIFHDATLAAIAKKAPQTLEDLQGISGIGARKLEAYAADVLRVVA